MDNIQEEINLISIINVLIKNKLIILSFLVIGIAFSSVATFLIPKTYESEGVIRVGTSAGGGLLENPEQLASTINFTSSDKYPSSRLTVVAGTRLIDIKNYSSNKDQVMNPVAEVASKILSDHQIILDHNKNKLETGIKNYESTINRLMQSGQQIAILQQDVFTMQAELSDFSPSEIVKEPTVFVAKKTSVLLNILIGVVFGIFLGVLVASIREWWRKNKDEIRRVVS